MRGVKIILVHSINGYYQSRELWTRLWSDESNGAFQFQETSNDIDGADQSAEDLHQRKGKLARRLATIGRSTTRTTTCNFYVRRYLHVGRSKYI